MKILFHFSLQFITTMASEPSSTTIASKPSTSTSEIRTDATEVFQLEALIKLPSKSRHFNRTLRERPPET